MAEENDVNANELAEENQVMKEPQRVTTKNPKKVEAGKRLTESNQRSKPISWYRSCYSSGSHRWSWLLHLANQESGATFVKPTTK